MSLNSSLPQPPSKATTSPGFPTAKPPNYSRLVHFLLQPFLESPESLSVDCEISPKTARVWLRVAFEGEDKGRVFGRGGRNIQAIRTVIMAVAELAGHSVYLDIYGSQASTNLSDPEQAEERETPTKSIQQRGKAPKPIVKPRSSLK